MCGALCRARGTARLAAPMRLLVALALALGGCIGETFQRGYVLPEGALEQIPLGASQEQVLIVLGTPSTVATVSGEAFYYISQNGRPRRSRSCQTKDHRSARDRDLFRQGPTGPTARLIRHQGRQGVRLRQPHHADRRRRPNVIHDDLHSKQGS